MKTMKRLVVAGVAVLMLVAVSATAFAATQYPTPAEVVAGLTGREVSSVIDERVDTGKTYGAIANDAGVIARFRNEMLKRKRAMLSASTMTQAQANAIAAQIEANQANCDGTGTGCVMNGTGCGMGCGMGAGSGQGSGQGGGQGCGGRGMGKGVRDRSCRNR